MIDFSSLLGPKVPTSSTNFTTVIDSSIKKNESFLRTIQKWRNLQISYIGKLAELHSQTSERNKKFNNKADIDLMLILQTLQNNHKNLVNKFNHDIFMVNFAESQKSIHQQKCLLESERTLHKQLLSKKQILERVKTRKIKLKKSLQQQLTLHVFSHDSVQATMDKKVKRFNKMKQIQKQQQEYELKVKETKQIFDSIIDKAKSNLKRFNQIYKIVQQQKANIITKVQVHLLTYAKSMTAEFQQLCKKLPETCSQQVVCQQIFNQFITEEEFKIMSTIRMDTGYLQVTLKIINDKTLDNIIEYSKDKQIKKRIKQILESEEINVQDTDQLTRQVQIVKKILKNGDCTPLTQFMNFIAKGCKFRMNFVFILQMFRLNSQFQISENQLKPIIMLINALLQKCHEQRDAFVLKQIMVLLLTYYVVHLHEEKPIKIYIVNFFKNYYFWKDLQLWESILIQCIYLQKKATIKLILSTSVVNNKNQLIEAEKTSVLNQILYIVRNMVLFDFTQKQVKDFSNKFVKLLKQDDKFLKDRSIDTAIKQQIQNKPPQLSFQYIDSFLTKPTS